jgi:hypothetical protein
MKSNIRASFKYRGMALSLESFTLGISLGTLLGGCYVVPVGSPYGSGAPPNPAIQTPAPPPTTLTFTARLYPSNELATTYGMVSAIVTNDLNGRGTFSTNINGETFTGEATRIANGSREGIANGAGNRGSYINCRYQMTSSSLGSGQCRLSNGALFSMHVGG